MNSDDKEFKALWIFLLVLCGGTFVFAYVDTTREVCSEKCYPNTYHHNRSSALHCICDLTETIK